jgi:hypothetical protein
MDLKNGARTVWYRRGLLALVAGGLMFLFLVSLGFSQGKMGQTISFSGVIERIHESRSFIVVNEVKILLPITTQVSDEKGNVLTSRDLEPGQRVTIEAVRSQEGLVARTITLKTVKVP